MFSPLRGRAQHGAQRDVDLLVVAVVVAAADRFGDANDLEAVSIERDEGAERRTAREEQLVVLLAEHNDLPALGEIMIIEEAALRDGKIANLAGS